MTPSHPRKWVAFFVGKLGRESCDAFFAVSPSGVLSFSKEGRAIARQISVLFFEPFYLRVACTVFFWLKTKQLKRQVKY